jgi:hypothetical protein
MTALRNPRREQYASLRARGATPARAKTLAGFSAKSSISTLLDKDPDVAARIEELSVQVQAEREERRSSAMSAPFTAETAEEWVLARLRENVADAAAAGDFKESNRALELINQIEARSQRLQRLESSGGSLTENALERLNIGLADLDVPAPPRKPMSSDEILQLTGRVLAEVA